MIKKVLKGGLSDGLEVLEVNAGEEFIHVFSNFAKKEGPFKWLAQGMKKAF